MRSEERPVQVTDARETRYAPQNGSAIHCWTWRESAHLQLIGRGWPGGVFGKGKNGHTGVLWPSHRDGQAEAVE